MRIVVLDGFTLNPGDISWEKLELLGEVTIYDRTPHELILERSKDAEIILTNKTPLSRKTLQQLPQLRYVGVLATGYDVVDVRAASELRITVTNVPGYGNRSVAQMVFALLLELCHNVQRHSDAVKNGEWSESPDFCFWLSSQVELADKTLGIMGYGSIGRQVAQIAIAFGMTIIAYSPSQREDEVTREYMATDRFRWVTYDELFEQADVLTLHCPLNEDTEQMINRRTLSQMKPSAFLVNTSRGKLIDYDALADALTMGKIAGAAVDVLDEEPPAANHPLFHVENCIITPHIAWASKEARLRLMQIAVDNIEAFLAGSPLHVVTNHEM